MTSENYEIDRIFDKLNTVLSEESIEWQLVKNQKEPPSEPASEPAKKDESSVVNYESFAGLVHMYALKDNSGNYLKKFTYNDKLGQPKLLTTKENQVIYALDFRNLTDKAIAQWKVSFISESLEIQPKQVVNAELGFKGKYFTFSPVVANTRLSVGADLEVPILFVGNLVNNKVAIAHDFKVFSGEIKATESKKKTEYSSQPNTGKYQTALGLLPLFFEANESGKRSKGNRIKWRYDDAFLKDGKDVGKDLSGGHFDAGDHLLTAHGEGYCFSNVGFLLHLYKDVFEASGTKQHYLNSLEHSVKWLLKLIEVKDGKLNRFFHWIPYSKNTHQEWEIPEKSNHTRNTYTIDWNNPGSEPVHNAGACLAWAYQVFKDSGNKTLADQCLKASKILFQFGTDRPGKYQSQVVYKSSSGYQDERCHHAISLYAVTKEQKYLNDARHTWNNHIGGAWGWFNHLDNSSYVSLILLAIYDPNNEAYKKNIKGLFDAWSQSKNGVKTIDGKLKALNDWATCSQGSGMGGLFAMYSHFVEKNEDMEGFNRSQLDYCLGDNPDNFSYVIGYGNKWLKSPHHRGSSGGVKMHEDGENKHPLIGALIGGKKLNGYFPQDGKESRSDWISAEVALSYQCNIIMSVVGAIK